MDTESSGCIILNYSQIQGRRQLYWIGGGGINIGKKVVSEVQS